MITLDDFVTETSTHVFTCFASDLAVFRQNFPRIVPTSLGNGQPFVGLSKKVDSEGDLLYVRYRQQLGCVDLIVFND